MLLSLEDVKADQYFISLRQVMRIIDPYKKDDRVTVYRKLDQDENREHRGANAVKLVNGVEKVQVLFSLKYPVILVE